MTGAIRGTSPKKLFQKLGLETLKSRCCLRKLCLFHRLIKEKSPAYLFQFQKITLPTLREVLKKVKFLFSRQKQTFSKFFLSCSYNGMDFC